MFRFLLDLFFATSEHIMSLSVFHRHYEFITCSVFLFFGNPFASLENCRLARTSFFCVLLLSSSAKSDSPHQVPSGMVGRTSASAANAGNFHSWNASFM